MNPIKKIVFSLIFTLSAYASNLSAANRISNAEQELNAYKLQIDQLKKENSKLVKMQVVNSLLIVGIGAAIYDEEIIKNNKLIIQDLENVIAVYRQAKNNAGSLLEDIIKKVNATEDFEANLVINSIIEIFEYNVLSKSCSEYKKENIEANSANNHNIYSYGLCNYQYLQNIIVYEYLKHRHYYIKNTNDFKY